MNLQLEKEKLINAIEIIDDEKLILKLKAEINQWLATDDLIKSVVKPMRENISVEDLIKEQNYQGFNKQNFDAVIEELDIKEPIEALLEQLN